MYRAALDFGSGGEKRDLRLLVDRVDRRVSISRVPRRTQGRSYLD